MIEAPGPECPRCWRRTGGPYHPVGAGDDAGEGDVNGAHRALLCERCAKVVGGLPGKPAGTADRKKDTKNEPKEPSLHDA